MRGIRVSRLDLFGLVLTVLVAVSAQAADRKPNILIIWGDDIGYWNVST